MELCLEELEDQASPEPYLRCVAVAGGQPGLCFSPDGEVVWKLNEHAAAELWVSGDDKLIFYRKQSEGVVSLTRLSRHLELPLGKPVVVLHGDEICVKNRRYRVHVHGTAQEIVPPTRLDLRRTRHAVVGAALAVSSLVAGCKQNLPETQDASSPTPNGQVYAQPPNRGTTQGGATNKTERTEPPPIDVRDQPPLVAAPPEPRDNGPKNP
jgi:hypothetical protein